MLLKSSLIVFWWVVVNQTSTSFHSKAIWVAIPIVRFRWFNSLLSVLPLPAKSFFSVRILLGDWFTVKIGISKQIFSGFTLRFRWFLLNSKIKMHKEQQLVITTENVMNSTIDMVPKWLAYDSEVETPSVEYGSSVVSV